MKGRFWPCVSTLVYRFWKTFLQVRAYFSTQFLVQPKCLRSGPISVSPTSTWRAPTGDEPAGVCRLVPPARCAESQLTNGSSEQLARTKAAKIRTVTVLFFTPNCSSKRATSSGGTKPDS